MKFKKLTEADKEYIASVYKNKDLTWDARMNDLCNKFSVSERNMRRWCSERLGLKERVEGIGVAESDQYKQAQEKIINTNKKVYLISWAQNNTKADVDLINGMIAYRDFHDEDQSEILIICGRYNNFNTLNGQKEDEYWDPILTPFLTASNVRLNSNLQVRGDIKIVPTNLNPLNGLEGLSNDESLIVGSPSLHFKALPVVDPTHPKILLTTGACTIDNYSQSLSGSKANFNHSLGFTVVEIKDDNTFFTRQVGYDKKTKQFTDLYFNVDCKNAIVRRTNEIEGIVLGDLHYGEHDEIVLNKTTNVLMKKLKPTSVVIHDVFSSYAVNVHDVKDIYASYRKEKENKNDVFIEISNMLQWLETISEYNVVIIRSNHDDMLDRWLKGDWRSYPTLKNSEKYMEYALLTLQGKAENGIIPYVINQKFPKFKCLTRNESYKIGGFQVSQHSDVGPNGSRGGGVNQFKKLSSKSIFGHSHSFGRSLGAICVGTNTKLRLDYNRGLSNWTQGSVIISKETLKAQLILFINGEFTTFK